MKKQVSKLEAAELLVKNWENYDRWVLIPAPISSLKEKREEFEKAVAWARVELVHTSWEEATAAARELSDAGGIETVALVRVKHNIYPNSLFKDGKLSAKNGGHSDQRAMKVKP